MTTYVHDGIEVVLTGRKASREIKPSRTGRTPKIDEIVEIKPADNEIGSWTKFVRAVELYAVIE